jgi:hypothetical protein
MRDINDTDPKEIGRTEVIHRAENPTFGDMVCAPAAVVNH